MTKRDVELGLKENKGQFILLLLINAFVGGMVGLERSVFPELAQSEFGLEKHSAILSFIIAFGISKAIANYLAGNLANRVGRKNLLSLGWLIGIPVPFIIIHADSWDWIVLANILLGINQGLAWSSTVVMKIDLVGPKQRGMAMGLNEFTGYFAVGLFAYLSTIIASNYGIRPYPFYLGIILSVLGLLLTLVFVRDTRAHVQVESDGKASVSSNPWKVFVDTTFRDKNLSATTQAGLVNNLNDGMIWGLLPILLFKLFTEHEIAIIIGLYPAVWGLGQLFTGRMADKYNNKKMLVYGMILQAAAILSIPYINIAWGLYLAATILGIGTALVYPTFLVIVSRHSHPEHRAESIGVFRLWRDSGYAIGALFSGIMADQFGIDYAIVSIGIITLLSSLVIQFRMD